VYLVQNRWDEARQPLEEALKIYRELVWEGGPEIKTSPITLMPGGQAFSLTLRLSPEAYPPHLADTLNSLGLLYWAQNRLDEARQNYEEALGIYKRLAARDPEQFQARITELNVQLAGLGK
jgi:tetratricopeptide (TPR) repeat protein